MIASGAGVSGLALLLGAAWFLGPIWFPDLTVRYSPWVGPVMRAVIRLRPAEGLWRNPLPAWAGDSPRRWIAIASYVDSHDSKKRVIALFSLICMRPRDPRPEIDALLFPLLRDHEPAFRKLAAKALTDCGSIPVLEAMGTDPDPDVAQAVATALQDLRLKAGTTAR